MSTTSSAASTSRPPGHHWSRWGLEGAEAVLKLRTLITNGGFDAYFAWHLRREFQRVHVTLPPMSWNIIRLARACPAKQRLRRATSAFFHESDGSGDGCAEVAGGRAVCSETFARGRLQSRVQHHGRQRSDYPADQKRLPALARELAGFTLSVALTPPSCDGSFAGGAASAVLLRG